jgi:hypothetical protein
VRGFFGRGRFRDEPQAVDAVSDKHEPLTRVCDPCEPLGCCLPTGSFGKQITVSREVQPSQYSGPIEQQAVW